MNYFQMMIKVIIAGGRDFNNYIYLKSRCDFFLERFIDNQEEIIIVSGGAKGADRLGEQYARERGFEIKHFPADWNGLGKGAGHIRNGEMANYSDCLISFWDGKSLGTEGMISKARKKELLIRIVKY